EEYLLRPALPLRIIECRPEYKAKVMGVTVWDRLTAWGKDKLEPGFEEGASIQIKLSTGETIPAEVRVFKSLKSSDGQEENPPQTGLRALINGQCGPHIALYAGLFCFRDVGSHAKRRCLHSSGTQSNGSSGWI